MALAAFIAMIHDLLITVGVYSLAGFQVTPDTVIAILTILGYSLYDTVVVFDRVRDNAKGVGASGRMTYSEMVNLSMNQTLARSINTSLVAILPVLAVLVVGAEILGATTLQDYGLALTVGLFSGAYSSIFIAAPGPGHVERARAPVRDRSASASRPAASGPGCSRPRRRPPWPGPPPRPGRRRPRRSSPARGRAAAPSAPGRPRRPAGPRCGATTGPAGGGPREAPARRRDGGSPSKSSASGARRAPAPAPQGHRQGRRSVTEPSAPRTEALIGRRAMQAGRVAWRDGDPGTGIARATTLGDGSLEVCWNPSSASSRATRPGRGPGPHRPSRGGRRPGPRRSVPALR